MRSRKVHGTETTAGNWKHGVVLAEETISSYS
jgi:hypothetical protein